MNSPEEKQKLIDKCQDLTIKLHKFLVDGNVEIPKELDEEVKKLIIQRASKTSDI